MNTMDPEKVAGFEFRQGPVACLLTHGFTGTPYVMRELGEYLADKGLTVLCRPLPGHASSPAELLKTNWHDWYAACIENLAELKSRHRQIFLCGLSMGGTLSLHLAAHHADEFNIAGVVSYSAPVYMKHPLFPLLPIAEKVIRFFPKPQTDVADPEARARVPEYDRIPLRAINSLLRLAAHVKNDLQDIHVPVLLMQSKTDHVVEPQNLHLIYQLLGTKDKTLVEVERSYHVITVDYDKEIVKEKTWEFIQRVADN